MKDNENINSQASPDGQASNELADQWQNMDVRQASSESKAETLPLYSEVGYGGYKISSAPFDNKSEAYDEIRNNWQGVDVTTHFYNGRWYIVSR